MGIRTTCRTLAFAVLAGLPCAAAWAQVPAGSEFRVNTYTTLSQASCRAAADPAGNFVVVWAGGPQTSPVVGQRLNADGTAQGGEFAISESMAAIHRTGGIAIDGRGNSVVVWSREPVQDAGEIRARRFDATGVALGTEFQVNTYTTGNQIAPRVSAAPSGDFVVVWESLGQDGSDLGVFARLFDPSGAPRAAEFRVNSYTTGAQFEPFIDTDASGSFVVVWSSRYQTGDDAFGVFGQRFDAAGVPQGPEFHVNTFTTGRQMGGSVAKDRAGNFVVTWESYQNQPTSDVFARRYDATGAQVGPEFRVNTYTTGWQRSPTVDADAAGNFVITWGSIGQIDFEDVIGQRYDSAGVARGSEFLVNSYTTGIQVLPEVASDSSGNFLVTWPDLNIGDVFAQRFGGLVPAALAVDAVAAPGSDGNGVFEAGETVNLISSWRNVNGVTQAFTGAGTAFTGPGTPGNPTYTIVDATANYGAVANGATSSCATAADCIRVGLSVPGVRPVTHWDAVLREDILPAAQGQSKLWGLHVGESFTDVPRTNGFYRFVETLLHRGVTAGCSASQYCPASSTTREQMAVFVLVAKEGTGYLPPACGASPMFADVPGSSPFCRWIEELARRGVVGGCGAGNYCPASPVSREQMAVFALRTLDPALNPPACVPPNLYSDVPETSGFCRWIEELSNRAVTSGCGGGRYCPADAVRREQMSVYLGVTFGLALYGV